MFAITRFRYVEVLFHIDVLLLTGQRGSVAGFSADFGLRCIGVQCRGSSPLFNNRDLKQTRRRRR